MSDLIKKVDEKTKLAGANKLEALTFRLGINPETGRDEIFGINVFKVREVIKTPEITVAPDMPSCIKGMVSIRGNLIPVIDLAQYCGIASTVEKKILILTEYNGKNQGFLVAAVDVILRISWSDMRIPPKLLSGKLKGLVTSVTGQADNLIMMLDVERVLAEFASEEDQEIAFNSIESISTDKLVFFVDDSAVARNQIQKTLEKMNIKYKFALNGKEAWEMLDGLAKEAALLKRPLKETLSLILTDVEMPEVDGFTLTKKIKSDTRFEGIWVLMHSSLSGNQNQALGKSVGVDEYISKFEPQRLALAIKNRV